MSQVGRLIHNAQKKEQTVSKSPISYTSLLSFKAIQTDSLLTFFRFDIEALGTAGAAFSRVSPSSSLSTLVRPPQDAQMFASGLEE